MLITDAKIYHWIYSTAVLQTDGRPVAHFDLIFIWATKFNNIVDQIGDHVIINVCDLLLEVKNHPGLML